jgi:opine dehydrogenase
MNNVTVVGAGNGGLSFAAWLALEGCRVNLYDKFEKTLTDIRDAGGVSLKSPSKNGFARLNRVTSDIEEALEGSALVMVATPAFAHRDVADACAPFLSEGQTVVLNPGRTAGALEFRNVVKERNPDADFIVAEAQSLLFACRKTGPAESTVYKVKQRMPLAALPSTRTDEVVKALAPCFPQFVPAGSVLETSLMNIGAIFHPVPAILNIARIDAGENFEHYMQGISPSVANVLERLDRERLAVASAMGVRTMSALEWLEDAYDVRTRDAAGIYEAIQRQEQYRGIAAPKDPFARYISEDVPTGLVPLSELGRAAGVGTPLMDAVVVLADSLHKRDYRAVGRNLKSLGLEGMSVADIGAYVLREA